MVFLAKEKALPGGSLLDKMELTTAEQEALHSGRFHHPHPRVQRHMEALSLQRQGRAPDAIRRLGAMAQPPLSRSFPAYRAGGSATLQEGPWHRRQGQWAASRPRMEAAVRQRPPARGAEAAVRIAALTGLQRGPTPGRQC